MANKLYKEYFGWLQPNMGKNTINVKISFEDEACVFAAEELRLGLMRFGGENALANANMHEVSVAMDSSLPSEGYGIHGANGGVRITGADKNGLLYGVYAFIFEIACGKSPSAIDKDSSPVFGRRIINHWDNVTGKIERGYAGKSLFFRDEALSFDKERVSDYARLLASVGINQISINNVNVTRKSAALLEPEMLPDIARLADIFRPFGIRIILAVSFNSPVTLGEFTTSDPLDENVEKWWQKTVKNIYSHIPDFAGFLIKADSEYQHGPSEVGRTSDEGANVIAKALAPYGGTLYWRCFVYDCLQDWRDTVTDRPMSAYQHFSPLDGQFDDNVVLQIKNGPVDFQVREPLSPLFGAMNHTRQGIELQITQEYTGQQVDLYALAVQWEEIFASQVTGNKTLRNLAGVEIDSIAGVSNVGDDMNWTGNTLAQCNLFSFGRLAWDPKLTSEEIIKQWIVLTFGDDMLLTGPLTDIMLKSRSVYEKYVSPLGIGWMVNVIDHYGPSVDGYEYSKWGTYHRADHKAIGVDRTENGTGFTRQYHPHVAARYNGLETCPENLLLFFHRLNYDYILKDGRTLIQKYI